HSFYHHGKFSKSSKEEIINLINDSINESNKFITDLDNLIITFGSSYVYKHKEKNIIVSNCHKLPENAFNQYMLSIEEMENKWIDLINKLKEKNKNLKIIFTVSPIRYLKYGFASNALSKSNLLVLVNKLKNKFNFIDYFPSYEIMMDDLRDYRFYEKDMIHPNEIAIEYIWDKFIHSYIDKKSIEIMNEITKLKKALSHRPRNPNSIENKNFILKNIETAKKIEMEYSFINLKDEIKILEHNL
ncbi:MAG: GSCFA domain-containing protein, partial [Candidatus Sericytochromatia bacterium]